MGTKVQKGKWMAEYDSLIKEALQKNGGFSIKEIMEITGVSRTTVVRHSRRVVGELGIEVKGLYSETADYVRKKDKESKEQNSSKKKDKESKEQNSSKKKDNFCKVKVTSPEYKKWTCKCKCREDGEVVFLAVKALDKVDAKKFIELNYNVDVVEVVTYEEHIRKRNRNIGFGMGRLSTSRRYTNEVYKLG